MIIEDEPTNWRVEMASSDPELVQTLLASSLGLPLWPALALVLPMPLLPPDYPMN